jgi:hypothetical protein
MITSACFNQIKQLFVKTVGTAASYPTQFTNHTSAK